ncbi:MAG: hypothetical protein C5B51_08690 [Terriglobia bacterium]|nr:MAG: hypothetical protein C5B51_08690 [Terriglobia bacterium]
MSESRRHSLIVPREHGAWGILLVPLVTGAAAGIRSGGRFLPVLPLTVAVLTLFWLRTPLENWLGTTPMRARKPAELRLVRRTVLALALVAGAALMWTFRGGTEQDLWWIGIAAAFAFGAQALMKKRWRKARVAAQMIGAASLTLAAPAAYYASTGNWSQIAWALWAANLLFAANQIHFVQLRIHAARPISRCEKLSVGREFLAAQLALILILALAYSLGIFSGYLALAFLPVLYRGFAWFVRDWKPLAVRSLGWGELSHAICFGVLLVFTVIFGKA